MLAPGVLLTDLYELTMLQAYWTQRMNGAAVFELFVRRLPAQRNFLLASGLEQAVDYLTTLAFTPDDLAWLREQGFAPAFVDTLRHLRFTGDLDAMPEGTAFFADEPILRVVAPLREAQLVESRLMNLVHYSTLAASKAVRCRIAAPQPLIVDFGLRRSHGAEAALLAARASYVAGFAGTATVEAGRAFGIPVFGTMAHSYVQAHADESEAFESFVRAQPGNAVLLIDTYDTEQAARKVVALAGRLASEGLSIKGVRIDSGDLAEHARCVRRIFDEAGLRDVTIFASGNLDEHRLRDLVLQRAPIDGFGVGTRMNVSADAPFLDCAYKLEEYDGRARRKRSEGKATWPGRKQVFRRFGGDGRFAGDTLALVDERAEGEPLLVPVLRSGQRVVAPPTLEAIRSRVTTQLAMLPDPLRSLRDPAEYPVEISPALMHLAASVDAATG